MKNILVLSASPRANGNSNILCDRFIEGAKEAGHQAEKILVARKKISGCFGCNACQRNGGYCVQKDDMEEIAAKMLAADVIVLAAPIYFYSVDAQMKLLIDRSYFFYRELEGKEFYMILTGAATDKSYMEIAVNGLRGYLMCIPGAQEKGIIYGTGAGEAGEVRETPAMQEAYEMGRNV